MDVKKVNAIPLSYLAIDGTVKIGNFMAEFNDATFSGDISAMTGTFSGKLTAEAVNAAANLNIAGASVARTTVSRKELVNGPSDKTPFQSIHFVDFIVPNEDVNGGFFTAGIQFRVRDYRGDNDHFMHRFRIVLDGTTLYESAGNSFGALCKWIQYFYHEVSGTVTTPGVHRLDYQIRFDSANTNVYPYHTDFIYRVDYIRK